VPSHQGSFQKGRAPLFPPGKGARLCPANEVLPNHQSSAQPPSASANLPERLSQSLPVSLSHLALVKWWPGASNATSSTSSLCPCSTARHNLSKLFCIWCVAYRGKESPSSPCSGTALLHTSPRAAIPRPSCLAERLQQDSKLRGFVCLARKKLQPRCPPAWLGRGCSLRAHLLDRETAPHAHVPQA
jgi:hypothetical protein